MMSTMTWTAPQVERVEPAFVGDERALLDGFLDYHRQTLLWKCSGLTAEQLKTAPIEPSNLTLLGLVRHLAEVERAWLRDRVAGQSVAALYCSDANPDGDFDDVASADAEADFATYAKECQDCREAVGALPLDFTFVHPRRQQEISLRWVYLHLIEEYARHNGHADLIRERIDGATGE
jgi:hypothetical protein